jgi:acetyltransferase-like isoleucine patch superfamily enzyme
MMLIKLITGILNYQAKLGLRDSVRLGHDSRISYKDVHMKKGCRIDVGDNSLIECGIFFDREQASVKIGDRSIIGAASLVCADSIIIGDDVLISWGCTIIDHNAHSIVWSERKDDAIKWAKGEKDWSKVLIDKVVIENKVWVGFNSIILKGLTVGEGAIIGAGSVVTKDVAPYTIVAGNPARFIREI